MKIVCCSLAASAQVLACPVCFQASDGPGTRGVVAGVLVLMAVTTGVLAVCGTFAIRFAKRERGSRD
jgi:hypothetical protein